MDPTENKSLAIAYGLVCHGIFLLAGAVMFLTILTGFQYSVGPFQGFMAIAINFLLLIQFPIGHSFFLSKSGMKILEIFAPEKYASAVFILNLTSKSMRVRKYCLLRFVMMYFVSTIRAMPQEYSSDKIEPVSGPSYHSYWSVVPSLLRLHRLNVPYGRSVLRR